MTLKAKIRTVYFCSQCGAEHPRWQGQCRECNEWNCLIEQKITPTGKNRSKSKTRAPEVKRLREVTSSELDGYPSGLDEFDRVLGGRILPGSTVLLGGEPGIGKSTLLLQVAEALSQQNRAVLYISGEESDQQIKARADRLGSRGEHVHLANTNDLSEIVSLLEKGDYAAAVIDSIQTVNSDYLDSPPGTVAQVREAAHQLVMIARSKSIAIFLVGHVTKEGMVAGPKVLEHIVDTVVYFDSDPGKLYRLLRVTKNRFGSVREIGLFEMGSAGLTPVSNPSSLFLNREPGEKRSGTISAGICEGRRPIMIEIQALVTPASYGNPQRVAGGIDHRKLSLLLAVLEKRCGYPMGTHDVFISVAGGLRLSDPALDLPILAAIVSSHLDRSMPSDLLMIGEVGLSGEVRAVADLEQMLREAERLGFTQAVVPKANDPSSSNGSIRIHPVGNIQSALDEFLAV